MEEFEEGRGDPPQETFSQDKYGTGRREEVVEDVGKREQYWIGCVVIRCDIPAFGQSTDNNST